MKGVRTMSREQILDALQGGNQRLVLLLKGDEIVNCSSPRARVDGDQVVVFVGGQQQAVDLAAIVSVGRSIVSRRALVAA